MFRKKTNQFIDQYVLSSFNCKFVTLISYNLRVHDIDILKNNLFVLDFYRFIKEANDSLSESVYLFRTSRKCLAIYRLDLLWRHLVADVLSMCYISTRRCRGTFCVRFSSQNFIVQNRKTKRTTCQEKGESTKWAKVVRPLDSTNLQSFVLFNYFL